jgi:hypothetical protein
MFTGRTIMKCYCLIFVVALLTSTNGLAEIYKCSDAQGNVQYADKPCAGESSVITPRSAPKVDENSEQRMQKTQRLLRAYQEENIQKKEQQAEARAEKQERKRNCASARDRYQRFLQASRVFRLDEEGNRVVYTDAERAQSTEHARLEVERWCD